MMLWDIYHNKIPTHLVQLSQTKSMQRLQQVGMNCGCEYTAFPTFAGLAPYSRFDHSMGAALIVWHFTKDKKQSTAALLHDIATPVFAHVIDFLKGDYMRQEATEASTAALIKNDRELVRLLDAFGLCCEDVSDYHKFPIADNNSPSLSADRLEYTLGNGVNYGLCTKAQAAEMYQDLIVGASPSGEPELMFQTYRHAQCFGMLALQCGKIYVSDEDRYAMEALAQLLKQAIAQNILSAEDLDTTEPAVIRKLTGSPFANSWHRFCGLRQIHRHIEPTKNGSCYCVHAKKRYIDPMVQGVRLSQCCPEFQKAVQAFVSEDQSYWMSAT